MIRPDFNINLARTQTNTAGAIGDADVVTNCPDFPIVSEKSALNHLFFKVPDYESLRELVFSGQVDFLDDDDKSHLLSFIEICDFKDGHTVLEHAVKQNDYSFLEKLFKLGVNINKRNNEGKTCLFFANNYDMIKFLINQGWNTNDFINELLSISKHFLLKDNSNKSQFLIETLAKQKALFLDFENGTIAKTLLINDPEKIIYLLKKKLIRTNEDIANLLIYASIKRNNYIEILHNYWKRRDELFNKIHKLIPNLYEATLIWALLQSKNLKTFAYIIVNNRRKTKFLKLLATEKAEIEQLRKDLVKHITLLMKKTGNQWDNQYFYSFPKRLIPFFLDLGINPNIKGIETGRHSLFYGYKKPTRGVDKIFIKILECKKTNINQRDFEGKNALEWRCELLATTELPLQTNACNWYLSYIRELVEAGLKLNDDTPFLSEAKKLTSDTLIQLFLSTLLRCKIEENQQYFLAQLSHEEFESLLLTLSQRPQDYIRLLPVIVKVIANKFSFVSPCPEKQEKKGFSDNFQKQMSHYFPEKFTQLDEIPSYLYPLTQGKLYQRLTEKDIQPNDALALVILNNESLYSFFAPKFSKDYRSSLQKLALKHQLYIHNYSHIPDLELESSFLKNLPNEYQSRIDKGELSQFPQLSKLIYKHLSMINWKVDQRIPNHTLISLLIELIIRQNSPIGPKDLFKVFEKFTEKQTVAFLSYWFDNPKDMAVVTKRYFYEESIDIGQNGGFRHSYSSFVVPLLNSLKGFHLQSDKFDQELHQAYQQPTVPCPLKTLTLQGKIIQQLGRTLLVQPPHDKPIQAYKFHKTGESLSNFTGEYTVTKALRGKKLKFSSAFHNPIGVYSIQNLPDEFRPYKIRKTSRSNYFVYRYQADQKYFYYLHDHKNVNEQTFEQGRSKFLRDSVALILEGIQSHMAEMFHNEAHSRHYLPLVDILAQRKIEDTMGAGRLHAALKSVEFPNARANGVADMRDAHRIDELIDKPEKISNDLYFYRVPDHTKKVYLQVNALSRVLLVDTLMLAYRRHKQGVLDWQDQEACHKLGQDIMKGTVTLLAAYTGESVEKCENFAKYCGINWKRTARQLSFWIRNDEKGYLKWIREGKIPKGLYRKSTKVTVTAKDAPNFRSDFGFSVDGENIDIGAFNGPLALTELEKSWALFVLMAVGLKENV